MRYKEDCQKMIDLTHIIREDGGICGSTKTIFKVFLPLI